MQHGLGSHIEDVMSLGTENFTTYMHVVWLSSIFYNACLGFIKISVLALYMRLGDKSLRRLAIFMLAVVICQVRNYSIPKYFPYNLCLAELALRKR